MSKVFVLHIKPIAHFLFSCFLLCHVGCCTKISWYAMISLKKNRFVEKCTTSLDYWSPLNRHPPLMEMFIIIAPPPPNPLAIFSFFYPLSLLVDLKWNLIQQNGSVMIQALKINQGTKFGTLKKPMFSLFYMIIIWFNGIMIHNI